MSDCHHPDSIVADNIDTVVRLEADTLTRRTAADRAADGIAAFVGSIQFVSMHVAFFAAWAVVNVGLVPGVPAFDPYPFALLCMIVSMEGVLLSAFVLIKQNRMGYLTDRRAHLDLQVNLLAEREVTRLLQLTEQMAARLGVHADTEAGSPLSRETEVEKLVSALDEKLERES